MYVQDLHTHTCFCDGKNTPEEMVQAAIKAGLFSIGFSGHSYTEFDDDFCMSKENTERYIAEVKRLQEKYADSIEVLLGVEQDQFAGKVPEGYDYAIGSTHYVCVNGEYLSIDDTAEITMEGCERLFGGDIYALCEKYFETEAEVIEKTGADIIGHFDLVSKFNEKVPMFDPLHPRYVAAWRKAADALIRTGAAFEINTGAISRGYKTEPYPSIDMINYIRAHGGKFILSSDSHSTETLCYDFGNYEKYLY